MPVPAAPLVPADEGPEDVVDQGRGLADDEDADHDDEYEGDVLLGSAWFPHLGTSPLARPQRLDELVVEEPETEEWPSVKNDEVESVGVDDPIKDVVSEGTEFKHGFGRVGTCALLLHFVLEESWNVVDNGRESDHKDKESNPMARQKLRRL